MYNKIAKVISATFFYHRDTNLIELYWKRRTTEVYTQRFTAHVYACIGKNWTLQCTQSERNRINSALPITIVKSIKPLGTLSLLWRYQIALTFNVGTKYTRKSRTVRRDPKGRDDTHIHTLVVLPLRNFALTDVNSRLRTYLRALRTTINRTIRERRRKRNHRKRRVRDCIHDKLR